LRSRDVYTTLVMVLYMITHIASAWATYSTILRFDGEIKTKNVYYIATRLCRYNTLFDKRPKYIAYGMRYSRPVTRLVSILYTTADAH